MKDTIVWGFLAKMLEEGRVIRCEQQGGLGGWELTDRESSLRRDDVSKVYYSRTASTASQLAQDR